jgi:hypothetical protein
MNRKIQICSLVLGIGAFGAGCGDDSGMTTTTTTTTTTLPDMGGVDQGDGCPASGDVMVMGDITTDTTWACDSYLLVGKVFVTGNSTLTIEPGTTIYGDTDGSEVAALIVSSGSQLEAIGTAALPIVFTSGNAVGDRITGDWAGVALLGNATLNNGTDTAGVFTDNLEGVDPTDARGIYGGNNDASSCGHLEYVRIEFGGDEFSTDNELNGLTLAGCGSGTTLSHIQVHRGKDDGIEFFGGTAGMDHVVISGASDDSLDWDQGWRGNVQFLVVHQFEGIGDAGFEADNYGSMELATPRSNPTIFNATMIGTTTTRGMVLREGTRATLRNFIISSFGGEPIDLRATTNDLSTEWPTNISIERSFFFGNGAYDDEATVPADNDDNGFVEQTAIEDAARNNTLATNPMIGSTSTTAPNYVPTNTALNAQATPPAGFDTTATYAGAFAPNGTNWTTGWTSFPAN